MLLRNAFLSGLSRSMLVEIFLLVVQVLVSFARDRDQQLLVLSSSPTLFLMGLITWMSTYPSLPSGSNFVMKPRQSPIFWNRRTRETKWKPPPGIRVVWVGEKGSGEEVWYWHKGTRASTYDLPPLPPE